MAQLKMQDGSTSEVKFDKQDKVDVAEHVAELLWKRGRGFFYIIALLGIVVTYIGVTYFTMKAKAEMQEQVTVFMKDVTDSKARLKTLMEQAEADIAASRGRLATASKDLEVKSKEIKEVSTQAEEQIKQFKQQQIPPPPKDFRIVVP
jgi:uncharacterized protein HemX